METELNFALRNPKEDLCCESSKMCRSWRRMRRREKIAQRQAGWNSWDCFAYLVLGTALLIHSRKPIYYRSTHNILYGQLILLEQWWGEIIDSRPGQASVGSTNSVKSQQLVLSNPTTQPSVSGCGCGCGPWLEIGGHPTYPGIGPSHPWPCNWIQWVWKKTNPNNCLI